MEETERKKERKKESNHGNKDRIEKSGNERTWQHVIYSNSTSV